MKLKDLKTSNLTLEQLKKQSKTRGCVLSAVGSIIYGVLKVFGCKTKDYYGIPYFEIGDDWGGVSFGWFFITDKTAAEHTKQHEVGHIVQNAEVGGLAMVGWSICSFARYWKIRLFGTDVKYDSWWFEGQATELGSEFIERMKGR